MIVIDNETKQDVLLKIAKVRAKFRGQLDEAFPEITALEKKLFDAPDSRSQYWAGQIGGFLGKASVWAAFIYIAYVVGHFINKFW